MKNEIEGLQSELAKLQSTLQQTKQGTEERIRALENEKCDTDTKYIRELNRFKKMNIHLERKVGTLLKEDQNLKTDIERQKQTFEKKSMETAFRLEKMERNFQQSKDELNEALTRHRKERLNYQKVLKETELELEDTKTSFLMNAYIGHESTKFQRWFKARSVVSPKYEVELEDYIKECFEICWLIAIQDQPIVFAPEPKHGDSFQSDVYTLYTETGGTVVDFLVWPALLLHENGPLLSKGVIQAYIPSGGEVDGGGKAEFPVQYYVKNVFNK